jgi:amidase
MAVQGPLARSAADLRLMFDIIKGPQTGEEVGLRVELPPARHERLSDFRVAVLPALDWLPVDEDILAAQEGLASRLSGLGATVETIWPEGFDDFQEYFRTYLGILQAMSAPPDPEVCAALADQMRAAGDPFLDAMAEGLTASAQDYFSWFSRREHYRQAYRALFREWDILLAPANIVNAFPHDESEDRTVDVNGQPVPYHLQLAHPSLCNLTGHPGTAFPVGLSREGLPVGLQVIGPYLEDYTTMRFAELIEGEFGGFQRPAGYD